MPVTLKSSLLLLNRLMMRMILPMGLVLPKYFSATRCVITAVLGFRHQAALQERVLHNVKKEGSAKEKPASSWNFFVEAGCSTVTS